VPRLKSFQSKDWSACRPCRGLDFRASDQIGLLENEILPYASEWTWEADPSVHGQKFHFENGFFERVDAEVAYSLVRSRKPRRVVEVGSGNSTLLLAEALRRNREDGHFAELVSIEPNPAPFLRLGIDPWSRLIEAPVQNVPAELFRSLKANDILFIDSSHVVCMDSDVIHECLRILPELAPGVLVHFHDIFTPLDYPRKFVVDNLCFWAEQYLLEAFLAFNSAFRILWSGSANQQFQREMLQQAFPGWSGSYDRMPSHLKVFSPTQDGRNVWPCSFWIERNPAPAV
jgi:hypothetical protein